MTRYSPRHLHSILSISAPTLRVWSVEFADFLSPTATPGAGRHRYYSEEDVRVLQLAKVMKAEGKQVDEIHAALRSGQRADLPVLPRDDLVDVAASPAGLALLSHFKQLTEKVETLEERLDSLGAEQAATMQNQLRDAYKEIGRLEALLEIEKEKNSKR